MIRLYFVGMLMGIADLIPGISGGTVAFSCGIYEELLSSIKTLRIQSFKKIAWPFLLPLFGGIATSILLFSKLFYFLLLNYRAPLFGLFFGMVAASCVNVAKDAKLYRPSRLFALFVGFAVSFLITCLPSQSVFGSGFFGILLAGIIGSGAMLLPGISGSFVLQLIGVYPLVILALATPTYPNSFKLLIAIGIGIALGFAIFSRAFGFLLLNFRFITLSLLVGFMAGGLKALWPFGQNSLFLPALLIVLGFFFIIYLNIKMRKAAVQSNRVFHKIK
jgi:putative membrane protein